ncbi:MAG: hypothetical protein BM565_09315 [Gammaproteobacteria bacterium MedPE]|nr:MAG: hypothetical protein BM565_09315 [Gammaproteobacteria bacterium MedPE]
MIKNKLTRIIAATALSTAVISSVSIAETGNGTASVEVKNSFDVAQTTPLSFGQIVAIATDLTGGADKATLTVNSDGSTADVIVDGTLASIVSITAGTAGTFTVSGAAPNTVLTIGSISDFKLTDPSGADTKEFDVTNLTTSVVTSGSPFTYDTDATGTLVFNVGATLETDTTGTTASGSEVAIPYENVTFTGTYTVSVDY